MAILKHQVTHQRRGINNYGASQMRDNCISGIAYRAMSTMTLGAAPDFAVLIVRLSRRQDLVTKVGGGFGKGAGVATVVETAEGQLNGKQPTVSRLCRRLRGPP